MYPNPTTAFFTRRHRIPQHLMDTTLDALPAAIQSGEGEGIPRTGDAEGAPAGGRYLHLPPPAKG